MKQKKIRLTKKALKQLVKLCKQYPVDFYLLNRAGANSSEILDVVSCMTESDSSDYENLKQALDSGGFDSKFRDLLAAEAPEKVTREQLFGWISKNGAENIADTGCQFYRTDDDDPCGFQTQCESLLREILDLFVSDNQKAAPGHLEDLELAVFDHLYKIMPAVTWVWVHISGHWVNKEDYHQFSRTLGRWSTVNRLVIRDPETGDQYAFLWNNVQVEPDNLPDTWRKPTAERYADDLIKLKKYLKIPALPENVRVLTTADVLLHHLNALADRLLEGGRNEKFI